MLESKLWGVPHVIWGVICLLFTIVWIFVWPKNKIVTSKVLQFFIIRWFHALTWLLLAIAAFIAAFNLFGGKGTAGFIALLSLPVYLIFLLTLVINRKR